MAADPEDAEVGMESSAEPPKPFGVGFLESAPEPLPLDVDVAVTRSITSDDSKLHLFCYSSVGHYYVFVFVISLGFFDIYTRYP